MSHAVFSLFASTSRRGSARIFARAFSTQRISSKVRNVVQQKPHFFSPFAVVDQRLFASKAPVDEDLDAALEDILGDAIQEAENPAGMQLGNHIQGSHAMPEALLEEDGPVDFSDPKILSTTNPRWIQAGIDPAVIDVLSAKGITKFTPVQAEAFGPILARRDVIGQSRTGTGKTLAFGIPSMTRLVKFLEKKGKRDQHGQMKKGRSVSMLVLCPTRELARQVSDELSQVARPLNLFVEVFHGGVSYDPQARALRMGLDILVGTPGRIIDHIERGNIDLSECDIVVLDEADEMLNMGFAEDVEVVLQGVGSKNEQKTQCLLFSATTPSWVKEIGRQYQKDVLAIDSTSDEGGARVANTVRHLAIQLPPGPDTKKAALEDIIAVHIVREEEKEEDLSDNPIAAKAAENRKNQTQTMQQKIFGKTIVFTQTKREADELVSGSVFKSLTAQALHGDVGQKQRDATLNAFRAGVFNVLVATDVAARGIDIRDVDLVIQFDPPRDVDTYVHRSGRTGRAGKKGVSILLFNRNQARDIVRIERDLGHGFQFGLIGPPSSEAAMRAAARTSALASSLIPDETAKHFKDAAASLLAESESPEDAVARCLAAISRRSNEVQSRSLLTGESGMATIEMSNTKGRPVTPNDVMFTIGKLSRMSQRDGEQTFGSDVGKIQAIQDKGIAIFDMTVEDAKSLVEFSKNVDAGGSVFRILHEMEIERDRSFGRDRFGGDRNSKGRRDSRNFNRFDRRDGPPSRNQNSNFQRKSMHPDQEFRGGGNKSRSGGGYNRGGDNYSGGRDGFRGRYDSRKKNDGGGW